MVQKSLNKTFNNVLNILTVSTDAYVLEKYDSGKVILWTISNAKTMTLPAAEAGLNFKIIAGIDGTTSANKVLTADATAAELIHGTISSSDSSDGDSSNGSSDDVILFGTAVKVGYFVELLSDGTHWYVVGSGSQVTTNGISFGTS